MTTLATNTTGSRAGRRTGQVLIITLLSLSLLVGLLFYVYNIGESVNRRMDLQSTADAVAVSGAGWMARSMNVVAMNNVNISRMLALVAVLDSVPLAAEMTIAEETSPDSLTNGLKWQLDNFPPSARTALEREDFLYKGLDKYYQQMLNTNGTAQTQLDCLISMHQAMKSADERQPDPNGFDTAPVTYWSDGKLWQAMRALDDLSAATIDSAGVLAQNSAMQFGRANGVATGFVTPVLPTLPAIRGQFSDFGVVMLDSIYERNPRDPQFGPPQHTIRRSNLISRLSTSKDVLLDIERTRYWPSVDRGIRSPIWLCGGAIPDYQYPHRMGPFARLYRWRNNLLLTLSSTFPPTGDPDYDATNPTTVTTTLDVGYSTNGPLEWALRHVANGVGVPGVQSGILDTTRFMHHLRRISTMKIAYMFGVPGPKQIQYASKWITDYKKAKALGTDPDPTKRQAIIRTQYYRAVVRSVVRWDSPNWLANPAQYAGDIKPLNSPSSWGWVWPADPAVNGWFDMESRFNERPRVLRRGWFFIKDPASNTPGTWQQCVTAELKSVQWEKVGDYVWRRRAEMTVHGDPDLNLPGRLEPDGHPILDNIYTMSWYVFRGSEIRDPVEIANPCNWPSTDGLPAPYLLNTADGDYNPGSPPYDLIPDGDVGVRRQKFTYLGSAVASTKASLWPTRFSSGQPGRSVALAQAKVFNNSSWDLWTQDWQVQLTPLTRVGPRPADPDNFNWIQRIQDGGADLGGLNGTLNQSDLNMVRDYLLALPSDSIETYVNH